MSHFLFPNSFPRRQKGPRTGRDSDLKNPDVMSEGSDVVRWVAGECISICMCICVCVCVCVCVYNSFIVYRYDVRGWRCGTLGGR
jgi:hypothetical protein